MKIFTTIIGLLLVLGLLQPGWAEEAQWPSSAVMPDGSGPSAARLEESVEGIPWPEHPRPNFKRSPWINLNGRWAFEFDPENVGEREGWHEPGRRAFSKSIIVPFPWQSELSGIGDLDYEGAAWYQRGIILPDDPAWQRRDAWLIFGACKSQAKVWVNGQLAAEHDGGYTPFEVNLSNYGKAGETVSVIVRAFDASTDRQTATSFSGIWQTVYLEPRGKVYIRNLQALINVRCALVFFVTKLVETTDPVIYRYLSPENEFPPYSQNIRAGRSDTIIGMKLPPPRPWTPESPHLYPIVFELSDQQGVIDRVETYFGLRETDTVLASEFEGQYFRVNHDPVYLRGVNLKTLHPGGIASYPSDAALRRDFELCKQLGLNMVRIEGPTPLPRALYWADRLGVLVMQDMPILGADTPENRRLWQETTQAIITRDWNHPSVFAWNLFSEGEDSAERRKFMAEMVQFVRQLDCSRLTLDRAANPFGHVATDLHAWYFCMNDETQARAHIREVVEKTTPGSSFHYVEGACQDGAPLINIGYGGIGIHDGDQDISWSYKSLTNALRLQDKICGQVYTRLTDVAGQGNGLVNYDRSPKEFGYDFWFPGFTVADLNTADFVAIDAPSVVELKPGQTRAIPLRLSHWSDALAETVTVRWRVDWLDRFGNMHRASEWSTRPAAWQRFQVVDAGTIEVDAEPNDGGVLGTLLVEVLADDATVARNYVHLLVDRGPSPRVEVLDEKRVAVRFAPGDYTRWSIGDKQPGREGLAGQKAAGSGSGAAEYTLKIPQGLDINDLESLTVVAELSSKADDEKLAWPQQPTKFDDPQTDGRKWPTDVLLTINGVRQPMHTLPDDPADARGVLSHHRAQQGGYGYLDKTTVQAGQIPEIVSAAKKDGRLHIRWEVPANAEHIGGLAIYGDQLGCYPLDPTVILTMKKAHALR